MPTTNGAVTRSNKRRRTGEGNRNQGRRNGGFAVAGSASNDTQGANYQVTQAKIAIASNPLIGSLPGKSSQRAFLPSAHADFIYAIIIEEYGTIVGFIIIILYLALFFRSIIVAKYSQTNFGALLAVGLMFSIVFQALVNMGVAVDLLPVTGQPLPLLSSGGSSFVFTSLALGMIQSIKSGSDKTRSAEKTINQVEGK